jgi:hypothetical protein
MKQEIPLKEAEILLDERMWEKWIQKNKTHDFVLARRFRASISVVVVVALFIVFSTLWN